jgi:hypothetical protein
MNERCTVYIEKKSVYGSVPALYDGETERLGDLGVNVSYCCVFSLSRSVVWSLVREVF